MSADTNLMPIPGPVDPVPVPRGAPVARRWPHRTGRHAARGRFAPRSRPPGSSQAPAKLRAKQIWHWIYHRGVSDFAAMSDIAKAQRRGSPSTSSSPGPRWSRRRCRPTAPASGCCAPTTAMIIEMVFIPDADRGTLCVSSQVGCTLNCRFCHTGTMKLVRNLEPGGNRRPGHAGARRAWRMAQGRRGQATTATPPTAAC